MLVGEVCSREVVVIDSQASILEAARLMREHHVGDLVVVEDRQGARIPVGLLSDRDIVLEVLAEEVTLDAVNVGDVMSGELLTCCESDDVPGTIKRMKARGVRRAPVVDDGGNLAGILTVDDLIELIAEELTDLVGLVTSEMHHERERRGG
jgi:CBS domain-containing protein